MTIEERHEITVDVPDTGDINLICTCGWERRNLTDTRLTELVEAALEHEPNLFYRPRYVETMPHSVERTPEQVADQAVLGPAIEERLYGEPRYRT
jgi:hypothetical protein